MKNLAIILITIIMLAAIITTALTNTLSQGTEAAIDTTTILSGITAIATIIDGKGKDEKDNDKD